MAVHSPAGSPWRPLKYDCHLKRNGDRVLSATGLLGQGPQAGNFPRHFLWFQEGRWIQAEWHPAVSQLRYTPQGGFRMTTNPNGWMGFLHRLGLEADPRHVAIFPVELRLVLSPELF